MKVNVLGSIKYMINTIIISMSEFLLCCVYDLIYDDTTRVVLIHYSLPFRKEILCTKTSQYLLLFLIFT